MKKQGVWVTRFVTLLLFVFVLSYMGYHVFDALYDPVSRVDVVLQEIEEVVPLSGVFVRQEVLLPAPAGIVEQAAGEAERVGKGQIIAYVYQSDGTLEKNRRHRELDRQLQQLLHVQQHENEPVDTAALDAQIFTLIADTLDAVDRGRYAALNTLALKGLIFRREYFTRGGMDLSPAIAGLTQEMDVLTRDLDEAVSLVTAEAPGTFSSVVDGYETLFTPELLPTLLPGDYDALLRAGESVTAPEAMGKLVTDFTWYFAAPLSKEDARLLQKDTTVQLRFVGDVSAKTLSMRVQSIGEEEDGRQLVVFSTQYNVADFIEMRRVTADLIYRTHKGVRIPREAVRLGENNKPGVYSVIVGAAVWKPITICYEGDQFYLVEFNAGDRNGLLPGDEVIVAAKDLYDGKLLR